MNDTLELETVKPETTKAVAVRHNGEVGQALTASQITERLKFIHQVMRENMTDGVDYGKVPGCGDKPGLFQPGAQKLSMTFQLNPEVLQEVVTDYPNYHRGYRLTVRVTNGAKFADGVGECSTLESKYRFRAGGLKCPACGNATIFKSKQGPPGWFCWAKKGGCGAQFGANSQGGQAIANQDPGKVEHDNPPDFWNTVRKMAFKRGFVHAIINATNTSELWSQDLEDLAANGADEKQFSSREHDEKDDGDLGPQKNFGAGQSTPKKDARPHVAELVAEATRTDEVKNANPVASPKHRDRMLEVLIKDFDQRVVLEYARKAVILLPTETLPDWPLSCTPATEAQMKLLLAAIQSFCDGNEPVKPFINPEPPPEKRAKVDRSTDFVVHKDKVLPDWKAFVIPFGKNKGKTLGELGGRSLHGYFEMIEGLLSPTFDGDRGPVTKKPEAMARDKEFALVLGMAMEELENMKVQQP